MFEGLAEVCRCVLRDAGHDVRGADGAAQAERLLPADDAQAFFHVGSAVVHPRQEVAVRIHPARQQLAETCATLEKSQHVECRILNVECIKFPGFAGYLAAVSFLPLFE